jgi:hypothetical protein
MSTGLEKNILSFEEQLDQSYPKRGKNDEQKGFMRRRLLLYKHARACPIAG